MLDMSTFKINRYLVCQIEYITGSFRGKGDYKLFVTIEVQEL